MACGGGGGGDSGGGVVVAANKWIANSGTYSACNSHVRQTLVFAAIGTNQGTMTAKDEIFNGDNCTGVINGTLTNPLPFTVTYLNSGVVSVSGMGASVQSLSIDRIQVSAPAMTSSLVGSGVQGLCVNYTGGNMCYGSLSSTSTVFDGGMYFGSTTLASLTGSGTIYKLSGAVLTKQ